MFEINLAIVLLLLFLLLFIMAVPKKRTSKAKTRSRKSNWKRQAFYQSLKAMSLAKSSLTMRSNSFLSFMKDKEI